jgi:hypothetical protein
VRMFDTNGQVGDPSSQETCIPPEFATTASFARPNCAF